MKMARHGGVDETSVGEDREAEAALVGREDFKQVQEVASNKGLAAGDRDMAPSGSSTSLVAQGSEQVLELPHYRQQFLKGNLSRWARFLIAVRTAKVAALGDVPLEPQPRDPEPAVAMPGERF